MRRSATSNLTPKFLGRARRQWPLLFQHRVHAILVCNRATSIMKIRLHRGDLWCWFLRQKGSFGFRGVV